MSEPSIADLAYQKVLDAGVRPKTDQERDALRKAIMLDCIFNETQRHIETARAIGAARAEGEAEERNRWTGAMHNICGVSDKAPHTAAITVTRKMTTAFDCGQRKGRREAIEECMCRMREESDRFIAESKKYASDGDEESRTSALADALALRECAVVIRALAEAPAGIAPVTTSEPTMAGWKIDNFTGSYEIVSTEEDGTTPAAEEKPT